jgi:hypothetical protein
MTDAGTGGNCATYGQIFEPVKPTTVSTPSARATRAARFMAVAPRVGAQDRLMPEVDRVVAHGLPREVVRDRVHRQPVPLQDLAALVEVPGLLLGELQVEVVARARDLEAVVAPAGGEARDLLERQVGPLAREERDGVGGGGGGGRCGIRHDGSLSSCRAER